MSPNQIAFLPPGGSGALTLIQKQVISSDIASVTFSSIPQSYSHLKLVWSGASAANAGTTAAITVNGVSSGYVAQAITSGPGGGVSSVGGFTQTSIIIGSHFGDVTFDNYQAAVNAQGNGGQLGATGLVVGFGSGGATAPITSINIAFSNGTHWVSGVFSLYGLQ